LKKKKKVQIGYLVVDWILRCEHCTQKWGHEHELAVAGFKQTKRLEKSVPDNLLKSVIFLILNYNFLNS